MRRRMAVAALLALAVLPVPTLALRAFRSEWRAFHPSRGPLSVRLSEILLPEARAVEFSSVDGARLSGWYQPSKNRAAVMLVHGSLGNRTDVLPEMKFLAEYGFGVLAFDLPGHGLSGGHVEWGNSEQQALHAAVDFLTRQSDVDAIRIGALGASMGGYVLVQAAASDLRLRAIVAAGTPANAREHTAWEYRRWGFLTRWPAFLAIRWGGMRIDDQPPGTLVAQLSPRALLVVAGTEDPVVPPGFSQPLYDAARAPKFWFLIEGAGHCDYAEKSSSYPRRVADFFSEQLLGPDLGHSG